MTMFWMLIFALTLAFIVAGVVLTLLKVQAGFRAPDQAQRLSDQEGMRSGQRTMS